MCAVPLLHTQTSTQPPTHPCTHTVSLPQSWYQTPLLSPSYFRGNPDTLTLYINSTRCNTHQVNTFFSYMHAHARPGMHTYTYIFVHQSFPQQPALPAFACRLATTSTNASRKEKRRLSDASDKDGLSSISHLTHVTSTAQLDIRYYFQIFFFLGGVLFFLINLSIH